MSRKYNSLFSFSGIAKGSTAVLEIPTGVTYDRIAIEYAGVNLDEIENIEVLINNKPIWQIASGQRLHDLNSYYKERNATAGVLDFWFIRPELTDYAMRRMTAIGTADVATFTIKFKIAATATAPVMSATAVKSLNTPLGAITKIKEYPTSSATGGNKEIDNIIKEGRILAAHFFKDDISNLEVELDSNRVYESSKSLGEKFQKDWNRAPLTAQATHVDFMLEGNPLTAQIVEGVKDMRFRPTFGSAGDLDIVVEYLSQWAGI